MVDTKLWAYIALFTTAQASCRLNDISNIIGGHSYSVDKITASQTNGLIVIAGGFTDIETHVSNGFVYTFEYDECYADTNHAVDFPDLDMGIFQVQATSLSDVLLLGYSKSGQDLRETVVLYDIDVIDAEGIGEGIVLYQTPANELISENEKGFFIGQYTTSTSVQKVFVVSSTQIRVYFPSDPTTNSTFKAYNRSSTQAAAIKSGQFLITAGLSQTDTTIAFYSLESEFAAPSFAASFAQDHGGAALTQLTAFDDSGQLHLLLALSLHQGSQSATILTYLKTDSAFTTQQVNSYGFAEAFKCLYVGTYGMDADLILVDSQNQISKITIILSNGSVSKQQISSPIPFYKSYSTISPTDRVATIKGWDQYVFGVSDFVELSDQRFNFEHDIGFVMALKQNRITQLLFDAPLTATNTILSLPFSNVSSDAQLAFTELSSRTNVSSQSTPRLFNFKNEWVEQMKNDCKAIEDDDYHVFFCDFFQIFVSYPQILSTLKPQLASLAANKCGDEVFTLNFAKQSKASRSMRSVCFPFYDELTTGQIPVNNRDIPILNASKEYLRLAWAAPIDFKNVLNPWVYMLGEQSDDNIYSSNQSIEFFPLLANNLVFKLRSDQFWSYTLSNQQAVEGTQRLEVECWSVVCPDFIKYDSTNFTFYSDFQATNMRLVNATYVYRVNNVFEHVLIPDELANITQTLMLNVTAIPRKVGINITLPFDTWYMLNRNQLKYYSPPSLSTSLTNSTQFKTPTQAVQDFKQNLSSEQKSATSKWTPEQIQKAYEEALQRISKPVVPIRVTTSFDAFGLLTVKFSSPVSFPSYLIEEANREIQAQGGVPRQLEFADVFFTSSNFEKASVGAINSATAAKLQKIKDNEEKKIQSNKDKGFTLFLSANTADKQDTDSTATDQSEEESSDPSIATTATPTNSTTEDDDENSRQNDLLQELKEIKDEQKIFQDYQQQTQFVASEEDSTKKVAQNSSQQPVCSSAQYLDVFTNKCVDLQIYFGSLSDVFQVVLKLDQDKTDLEVNYTKHIVSFSATEIKVQFNFTDPLAVTTANRIWIKTSFAQFQQGMSSKDQIEQPCQKQILPGTGAAVLAAVGKASTAATTATVVGSAILQTIVSGCLAQIWGMINGMQFIMHLPAINVDFPSNAFSVIQKIMAVVTFDIPKLNMETVKRVFTLPENDSILDDPDEVNIKTSFELLGYASIYMSNNLGSVFVIILATTLLLFFSAILEAVRHPSVLQFNAKIKEKLHWNFVIRLVIEGYMELVFSVYFNLRYAKCTFSFLGSWLNYFYAIAFAALIGLAPFFVVGFYSINFSQLGEEEFSNKYGSVYEGLKTSSRSVIAFTTIFLIRRALFALLTVLLYKHVIIQLIMTIVLIMISACYILHFKPFEEPLINRLEVMNETITLLLVNLIFMFTPIIDSPKIQYNLGIVFVCIMALCISAHLFFIFKDIVLGLIRVFKRWRYKRALLLKQQQDEEQGLFDKIQLFLGLKSPKVIPIEENQLDQNLPNSEQQAKQLSLVSESNSIDKAKEQDESESVVESQNEPSVLKSIESNCSGPIGNLWQQREQPLTFPIERLLDNPPTKHHSTNDRCLTNIRQITKDALLLQRKEAQDATRNMGLQHVIINVVEYNDDDSVEMKQVKTNVSQLQESQDELDFEQAYEQFKQKQNSRKRFNNGKVGVQVSQHPTAETANKDEAYC